MPAGLRHDDGSRHRGVDAGQRAPHRDPYRQVATLPDEPGETRPLCPHDEARPLRVVGLVVVHRGGGVQADDAEGKTSQFVGTLTKELRGKNLIVTIPIKIAGERFRFVVHSPTESHEADMPVVQTDDEAEQKLYLTPGGRYTDEDIKANRVIAIAPAGGGGTGAAVPMADEK